MKKGLIGDIIDYNMEVSGVDMRVAFDMFFDRGEDAQELFVQEDINMLFNEWLVFDYRLPNDKSLVENYLKNNFDNLSQGEIKECTYLLENTYSLFKIKKVWKEEGLLVKDMISGKEYDVKEKSMTRYVSVGDITFLRLVKFDDVYEIVGGTTKAISDFDIDERITTKWKDEELTPKNMFALLYADDKKENTVVDDMNDKWNVKIDPQKAKDEFAKVLKDNNLDKFVSISVVQDWMENVGTKDAVMRDINDIVDVFANLLLKDGKCVDISEDFIIALNNLNNITKQVRLDGKSLQEKKCEESEREPDFKLSIRQIGGNESGNYFDNAIELMKDEKYKLAREETELGAEVALKNRDVYEFEYRIIANYAVCFIAEGEYELGVKFLEMSLDLNPNYGFAQDMLTQAQNAVHEKEIKSLHEKIAKDTENMYDPQEVQNKWSEKNILDNLASIDVYVDKDELMKFLRRDLSTEKYWKTKLLPQLKKSKSSNNRWDEDLLWMSTYALWKKYKKDDDFLKEHLFHVMTDITAECEKDDLDYKKLDNYFKELDLYLEKAPDKAIKGITEYNMELHSFVATLVWLLKDDKYIDKIYNITKKLAKRIKSELFELFDVLDKIENEDENEVEWTKHYHKIVNKNKYCISVHLYMVDFLEYVGIYKEIEEKILVDALDIVKLREQDKKWDVNCYMRTIYDDYIIVINYFKDLYIETKQKKKMKDLQEFENLINSREEELSYSPRNEKMDKELEEMESDTEEMQRVNKILKDNPMRRYYDFLKKTEINFETEEMTEDTINKMGNRKRVGRNELCPCGSGKKYKKCCL